MKHFKDIKKKIYWEEYYNPNFDWSNDTFYIDNKLSEDFIREFKDEVYWEMISKYQTLSEDLIREFKDDVDWWYISKYQTLSEDFIREFKEKIDWHMISKYQTLSKEFKNELNKIFYEAD